VAQQPVKLDLGAVPGKQRVPDGAPVEAIERRSIGGDDQPARLIVEARRIERAQLGTGGP
jgi:hypothetical protein